MTIAKVSVSLAVILNVLNPPETIDSVDAYKEFIQRQFGMDNVPQGGSMPELQPKRPVGRPPKAQHSAYSAIEMKAIREMVQKEAHIYVSAKGVQASDISQHQPDDETQIALNNGQTLHFSQRIRVEDGEASTLFPPAVAG